MRRTRAAALLSVALLGAGCGIDPQAAPEELDVSPIPPATAEPTGSTAGPELVLWFLEGDRLEPVERSAARRDPGSALDLLAEGPTAEEAEQGITTAISRQPLSVADEDGADARDGVLTVEVTPAFTGVGADQLRGVAQVVWTATEFDEVDAVRFATADGPLEVPTDAGLTDEPVDRADYGSLAPDGAVSVD